LVHSPSDVHFSYSWIDFFLGHSKSRNKEKIKEIELKEQRRTQVKSLTPDELVKDNPRNFSVRYQDVISAELKQEAFSYYRLRVKLSSGNTFLDFRTHKKQIEALRGTLKQFMPDKLVES
jgi:hypothetical protein